MKTRKSATSSADLQRAVAANNAFAIDLYARVRASADAAASLAETFFDRTNPASSAADRRQKSSIANSLHRPFVTPPA